MTIQMEWNTFDVEPGAGCNLDYVEVRDPPAEVLIGRFCGTIDDVPKVIKSSSTQLSLDFRSDGNVNTFQGFLVSFEFVEPTISTTPSIPGEPTVEPPSPGTENTNKNKS